MEDNIKSLTNQNTPQRDVIDADAFSEKKIPNNITQMLINMTPDDIVFIEAHLERMRAKRLHEEVLEYTLVSSAINHWLLEYDFNSETPKNYAYYMKDIQERGIIPKLNGNGKLYTLGELRHTNHQKNINDLKQVPEWSEGTRQLRIACYLSFMSHLSRITDGWFPKPTPNKVIIENSAYYKAQQARTDKALTLKEWQHFIKALNTIDERDSLIARCLLYNTTMIPVLSLRLSQINFDRYTIDFKKADGTSKLVTFPASFMYELQQYIETTAQNRGDSDFVFTTRSGKRIVRSRCNYVFLRASEMAQIKRVTPYSIRATFITLVKGESVDNNALLQIPRDV